MELVSFCQNNIIKIRSNIGSIDDLLWFSSTVLVRLIGKVSQRIITIFNVLANISFDVLPSLQFILLFFAFGSVKGGEFTFGYE